MWPCIDAVPCASAEMARFAFFGLPWIKFSGSGLHYIEYHTQVTDSSLECTMTCWCFFYPDIVISKPKQDYSRPCVDYKRLQLDYSRPRSDWKGLNKTTTDWEQTAIVLDKKQHRWTTTDLHQTEVILKETTFGLKDYNRANKDYIKLDVTTEVTEAVVGSVWLIHNGLIFSSNVSISMIANYW